MRLFFISGGDSVLIGGLCAISVWLHIVIGEDKVAGPLSARLSEREKL